MSLLNPSLYAALVDRFGDVRVTNEGIPGEYTCPPLGKGRFKRGTKEIKFASVLDWGEVYSVCCPGCRDMRHRLFISHYTGESVALKTTKDKKTGEKKPSDWYQFGSVYHCHNEQCVLTDEMRQITHKAREYKATKGWQTVVENRPSKFTKYVLAEIQLPMAYPLMSSGTPDRAREYLQSRLFDTNEIMSVFDIRFLPKGSQLWKSTEDEWLVSRYDRLLIPIYQGLRVVGWQARMIDKITDKKQKKYIFPPLRETHNIGKNNWLYNKDVAKFHEDMVLVEGVTDVWRVGPNAVCSFGKTLSPKQIHSLKLLWGYSGSCVICFDSDTWTKPKEKARLDMLVRKLREEKVFPRGVAVLYLPEGYDPADYPREQLLDMIAQTRAHCTNDQEVAV